MKIELDVIETTVVVNFGSTDTILMKVNMPSPVYPFDDGTAYVHINAAHNSGAKYVRDHFGIEPTVIRAGFHR
jgi:hypothetical protein